MASFVEPQRSCSHVVPTSATSATSMATTSSASATSFMSPTSRRQCRAPYVYSPGVLHVFDVPIPLFVHRLCSVDRGCPALSYHVNSSIHVSSHHMQTFCFPQSRKTNYVQGFKFSCHAMPMYYKQTPASKLEQNEADPSTVSQLALYRENGVTQHSGDVSFNTD